MLRIRFICVAAATVSIAFVVALSGAAAQGASAVQSDTPPLLAQLFGQAPNQAAASPAPAGNAAAPAVKPARSGKFASRKHRAAAARDAKKGTDQHSDPAQSNASADAWLAASSAPANSASASPSAPADAPQMAAADPAQQDSAPAANAALPSTVEIGGQTVQIAEADQVNEIDLAEAHMGPTVQSTMESTLPRGDRAGMIGAAEAKAAQANATQGAFAAVASAAPNAGGETLSPPDAAPLDSAAQEPGAQIINDQIATAQDFGVQSSTTVSAATWIAQVLAALGGAVTAGIVAWFLIGAEPVRTYG